MEPDTLHSLCSEHCFPPFRRMVTVRTESARGIVLVLMVSLGMESIAKVCGANLLFVI